MTRLLAVSVVLTIASATLRADDLSKAVIDGTVVDEAGKSVVGATIRGRQKWWLHPDATAITAADGRFRLELDAPLANATAVYATTPDGAWQGQHHTDFRDFARIVDCRIVLRPAATVRITVVDGRGAAVPGAVVALDDAEEMLAHAMTDGAGTALLRVPADAKVSVVAGFKGGVGFDYFENYDTSAENLMPVPAAVKLVLSGARTVRIRAADSADQPLTGIPFCPFLVAKKGKIARVVSTSFLYGLADTGTLPRSGADGIAVCDWFPLELKRASPFVPIIPGFHCPAWPYFDQSTTTVEPARLLRIVKASGRVTGPDGPPVVGILVGAAGRGNTTNNCTAHARTAADGTYSLGLYPDQEYVVAVADPDRTGANITGLVIREGRPRTDLDFHLGPGVLVEGDVTVGPKGEPAVGEMVYLRTLGVPLSEELGKEVMGTRPGLTRWATIDSAGRYRLRVGPGEYQVAGPDGTYSALNVGPEAVVAVRRDFHLPRLMNDGPIEVIAHYPDGTPVAGATLLCRAFDDARTDDAGRFRGTRGRMPALVYVYDPSSGGAAIAAIGPDDGLASLTLQPAARATGRVVGADGRPRADCSVTAIIRPAAGGTPEQYVRRTTYGGVDGSVTLTGLVDGTTCEIIVCSAMKCGVKPVKKFDVRGTDPIDLGDLVLPPDE